jgi:hypothetical protein
MRLKQNELIMVLLFHGKTDNSDYIGTEIVWEAPKLIQCNCQTAENQYDIALYGMQVTDMKKLYCSKDAPISQNDGVSFDRTANKPDYRVRSVQEYSTHKVVLVDRGH